jgi:UDP-N-acetylmuramate: L-alanyl-gamma-D-glutamyl-meso-diaminopimelate ligase
MNKELNRIHFIAIGGSVMHQLAIALAREGRNITGSDDEFFEPSKSLLEKSGLLPVKAGWFAEKITDKLDAVILGMHARRDNPELQKAFELTIPIYSFPEFIYLHSKDKQRFVISGSHGKTTITAMIIHVLNYYKKEFDYVIGAKVDGLDSWVKLSDAPVIILEGDEYASSPLDKTPKFMKYKHHIGVINGIAWDHMNIFHTEEAYLRAFEDFADATPKAGSLFYCEEDSLTSMIGIKQRVDVNSIEYKSFPFETKNGNIFIKDETELFPVKVFGKHNMQNMGAAQAVLRRLGISSKEFLQAMGSFTGASSRLEVLAQTKSATVYKDYAHSPSKVLATMDAVREQHPGIKFIACFELHTYSSLNSEFIKNYKDSLNKADQAIVYYNQETSLHKKLNPLTSEEIKNSFNNEKLAIVNNSSDLKAQLDSLSGIFVLLLMSSGNFGELNLKEIAQKITS